MMERQVPHLVAEGKQYLWPVGVVDERLGKDDPLRIPHL